MRQRALRRRRSGFTARPRVVGRHKDIPGVLGLSIRSGITLRVSRVLVLSDTESPTRLIARLRGPSNPLIWIRLTVGETCVRIFLQSNYCERIVNASARSRPDGAHRYRLAPLCNDAQAGLFHAPADPASFRLCEVPAMVTCASYLSQVGPDDGPMPFDTACPILEVYTETETGLARVGIACPRGFAPYRDERVTIFNLTVHGAQLAGLWVCDGRRFVPLLDGV